MTGITKTSVSPSFSPSTELATDRFAPRFVQRADAGTLIQCICESISNGLIPRNTGSYGGYKKYEKGLFRFVEAQMKGR